MLVRLGLHQGQQRAAVGGQRLDASCTLKHLVSKKGLRADFSNQRGRAFAFGLLCGGLCG